MREPFSFQIGGSDFLRSGSGHMLAADPGLGKTYQTIRAFGQSGAKTMLVVCPTLMTNKWVRETKTDLPDVWATEFYKSPDDATLSEVVSISIDNLAPALEFLKARAWDYVAVDEAHYARNPEAARTQLLYDSGIKVGKYLQLTATPTPKHAGNLWTHINATAPERIDHMSYAEFTKYYCTWKLKRYGSEMRESIEGNFSPRIPELRERLSGWWLRQRKDEHLPELPPKTYNPVYLPASRLDLSRIRGEFDPDVLEQLEYAIWVAQETGNLRELEILEDHVSRLRRLLAMAKVPMAVDYADMLLQGGEPCLVVWGWHPEPLKEIVAGLSSRGYRAETLTGQTGTARNVRTADKFQDGGLDVVAAQIIAGGIGIDLFRSKRAVFVEESFLPSDNQQAQDRVHRIGQVDPVVVDRLILEGSIDEAVAAICGRRTDDWDELQRDA